MVWGVSVPRVAPQGPAQFQMDGWVGDSPHLHFNAEHQSFAWWPARPRQPLKILSFPSPRNPEPSCGFSVSPTGCGPWANHVPSLGLRIDQLVYVNSMIMENAKFLFWEVGVWVAEVGHKVLPAYVQSSVKNPEHPLGRTSLAATTLLVLSSLVGGWRGSVQLHWERTPGTLHPVSPGLCPMSLFHFLILICFFSL